jgi:hypothetical protein
MPYKSFIRGLEWFLISLGELELLTEGLESYV